MIETEEQRRWWFATHPEYSWSRRGIRKEGGVDPEEVDKYVDKALKYETGPVADLLKSVKRNFGTESQVEEKDRDEQDKDDLAKWEAAIEADKRGLEPDPHTFLDVFPHRKFITSPIQAFRNLLRGMAQDRVLSATKKARTRPPARLPARGTPERRKIDADRERGKNAKKREELADVRAGGKGSGVWSDEELEEIRRTGNFPKDTEWHHDPTVANRPDLAADPRVVHPMRGGRNGHFRDGHNMNWQNPRK
jgi:hypothetical protein